MAKSPAFQFYAADFLTDTAEMTDQEVGVYIRLLAHQWVNGSIHSDPKRLCSIATSLLDVWQHISYKFVEGEDGRLRNPRLEKTRTLQEENREKRRIAGSKGGKAKQMNSKQGSKQPSKPLAKDKQKGSSSSSSSSSVLIKGVNQEKWGEYVAYRKKAKLKTLQPASVEQQQKWLVSQGDENTQAAIIGQTIRNGWQGLFELKENQNGKTQQPASRAKRVSDRLDDLARQAIERGEPV